jgi:uncharacterized protein
MSEQKLSQERIAGLDVIRGLAVLGILFVNIPEMLGNGAGFQYQYTDSDAFVRLIYDMLFQTKFYTIFAFLFGLGFYIFWRNATSKGLRPKLLFTRRLLILLLFGLIHAILLWYGDILHAYAVVGFLLLWFYNRSSKTLAIWSGGLLILFTVVITLATTVITLSSSELQDTTIFKEVPNWRERAAFLQSEGLANLLLLGFEILGLFLLGIYAGKKRWFEKGHLNTTLIRRVQWGAFILSVLLFIPMVSYYSSHAVYVPNHVYPYTHLTGKTLAVFYVCTLLRWVDRYGEQHFSGLAAVGRMSLSNYLLQTILTVLVMRQFWTNAADSPLWAGTVYAIVVVSLQIVLSRLWLRYYRMGPAEWLWRAGTYGGLPAFRRPPSPSIERASGTGM